MICKRIDCDDCGATFDLEFDDGKIVLERAGIIQSPVRRCRTRALEQQRFRPVS
jgi:hypothetical protein